jgi:hypothetical protein
LPFELDTRTAKSAANTETPLIRTLRKIYGQSFAAGYPETEKLREVLLKLNETWRGQDSQNEQSSPIIPPA